jgi:hypothetical protein
MNPHNIVKIQSTKSQHPWIQNAKFEALSQAQVLEGVLQKVKEANSARINKGGLPIKVVFDLDSTIFDVKPRSLRILKEFALSKEARAISAEMAEWSLSLPAYRLLYTLEESAKENSAPADEKLRKQYLQAAFQFWLKRFFTNEYLAIDQPTLGAVEYVNRIVDAGAIAVYLTGRDWPGMGKGTRSMLEQNGFPMSERCSELFMKPNFQMDDAEYKDEALRDLRSTSHTIALFDNEPANFHVFEKNFPEAWLVLFHSNCSQKEAKPVKRIYKIDSFLH